MQTCGCYGAVLYYESRRLTCSLRPVKVAAILQKRMWPVPLVMSCPANEGEKQTCSKR